MTRTEHDCRWRLLQAYLDWLKIWAPHGCVVTAGWQFYLAMGLRAPFAAGTISLGGEPPQEARR